MDKIRRKYDDLHVAATCVYVNADDGFAYADSSKTVKITAPELKGLFEQGVVIVDGYAEYKPFGFSTIEGVGILSYIKVDGENPTTPVVATLSSE